MSNYFGILQSDIPAIIFAYPQILVTIGFLIAYVYLFHSIKRRGVSILESNELETKQLALVIFIIKILTGLIVIVIYCDYLFKIKAIECQWRDKNTQMWRNKSVHPTT